MSSLVAGLISALAVMAIIGLGELLSSTTIFVIYVFVLLSFYLAPLPVVMTGFAKGLDAGLMSLIIIMIAAIAFFDTQTVVLALGGFCVPMLFFIIMHDYRLVGYKNTADKTANASEKASISSKLSWLHQTRTTDARHRMGLTLILTAAYFTAAIIVIETTLKGLGLETQYEGLINAVSGDETFTPQELQLVQQIVPAMELIPAAIAFALFLWVIASLKLGLLTIRWRRGADIPRLAPSAAAIPPWYLIIVACVAVIASQVENELKFILGNGLLILAIPGLLVGLGLIHHLGSFFRFPWLVVMLLYFVIGLTAQLGSLAVVTVIGFLDASLHIREWLTAKLAPKMEKKYA